MKLKEEYINQVYNDFIHLGNEEFMQAVGDLALSLKVKRLKAFLQEEFVDFPRLVELAKSLEVMEYGFSGRESENCTFKLSGLQGSVPFEWISKEQCEAPADDLFWLTRQDLDHNLIASDWDYSPYSTFESESFLKNWKSLIEVLEVGQVPAAVFFRFLGCICSCETEPNGCVEGVILCLREGESRMPLETLVMNRLSALSET